METLVFASNNAHKLEEVRAILGGKYDIKSLSDIDCHDDIPETGSTFRENALQKAMYVKEHYGLDCFADDSGLQVEALGGEPGVWSARYASLCGRGGTNRDEANMDVLLERLSGVEDRRARFSTCIALVRGGEVRYFEGEVRGQIIDERRGGGGFGYDPVFVPEGYEKTFSELGDEVKNRISHRAQAVAALAEFLG